MENIDALFAGIVAAITLITEGLKYLIAKISPKLDINPRILQWIAGALVIAGVIVFYRPETGGKIGALLFAFLSSSGVYDHFIQPLKNIIESIKKAIN